MYTRYKTPVVCNLNFDHVTFTPKLLLKDMDLGLAEGRKFGVPMPTASATRDACQAVVAGATTMSTSQCSWSSRHGTPASSLSPRT